MPWSKTSQAPVNIQKLNGISLTLEQLNWIARVADSIPDKKFNWAIAVSKFKKSFTVAGDSWKKNESETKEYSKLQLDGSLSVPADVMVEKQKNGRYKIVSVSTAALEDREGETFTVKAIDYEIKEAQRTGEYPEFRVFHTQPLGIGRVKSMRRVGIFAVEEGESYDDPFSLEVCEKMLSRNDGKWRTSRGFKVLEASGGCPKCGESILVREKHMHVGFICPVCKNVNLGFKGSLTKTRFLKTKTFDITVTDIPAVPWTGVAAYSPLQDGSEDIMKKEILRKRLVKAGISEDVVDARLKDISEDTLKSFDDIPMAEILKEFGDDDDPEEDDQDETEDDASDDVTTKENGKDKEQVFVLDPAVLKEFARISNEQARIVLKEFLEGATLETEPDENVTKEIETLDELKEMIQELTDAVAALTEKDETRLKELVADAPRGSALRINRFKEAPKKVVKTPAADTAEDEDDGTEDPKKVVKKESGVIVGSDGKVAKSMTEFVAGVTTS
jgi:phage FluMu protein Com